MAEPVKVMGFKVEQFKRVQLVDVTLNGEALVIGGENGAGKTSILDALCVLLGGAKQAPSEPIKDGSGKAMVVARFSNGVVAERRFTEGGKTYLYVNGTKGGQELLDAFVSQFALDVSAFMNATDPERSKILLKLGGLDLDGFAKDRKALFDNRTLVGRERDKMQGAAAALPHFPEVEGKQPADETEFARQLQAAAAHNAGLDQLRLDLERIRGRYNIMEHEVLSAQSSVQKCDATIARLEAELEDAKRSRERFDAAGRDSFQALAKIREDGVAIKARIDEYPTQPTATILADQEAAREVNRRIRANQARAIAQGEAAAKAAEYDGLTAAIEKVDADRTAALQAAKLPLQRMAIADDGQLLYGGQRWDCMSESERLICAAAVGKAMKPEMGFVLIDGCEKLSRTRLGQFLDWCRDQGIQPIMTRVSDGPECGLIIEDGKAKGVA